MYTGAVDTSSMPDWANEESGVYSVEDRSVLLKDDFLKLLVAQLQNQDPMSPADNQEFAAQLAQFSSLEQMTEMNESLSNNLELNSLIADSINNNSASNFIGKVVHAVGAQVHLAGEGNAQINVYQENASAETTVGIYDISGNLIDTVELGPQPAGGLTVEWDGEDSEGNRMPEGTYMVEVSATDYEGNTINTSTFMMGRVTGIRYYEDGARLLMGSEEVSMDMVIEVLEPGTESE